MGGHPLRSQTLLRVLALDCSARRKVHVPGRLHQPGAVRGSRPRPLWRTPTHGHVQDASCLLLRQVRAPGPHQVKRSEQRQGSGRAGAGLRKVTRGPWPCPSPRLARTLVKVAQSCPTLCDPMDLYSPWTSPGQNTGVGSPSLLQGVFPTQGSNPALLHCRRILYQIRHKGSQDPKVF